ncbi:MAG: hypothetical protein LC721_04180, partial [Actinobacteria bacterium]|nr:hypothetical protein [Actinomycetota bacterium]
MSLRLDPATGVATVRQESGAEVRFYPDGAGSFEAPPRAGYLTAWPSDAPRPNTSQLNYGAGQAVANAAMVKLAADGTISLYASGGPVDLIVDVAGYYQPTA